MSVEVVPAAKCGIGLSQITYAADDARWAAVTTALSRASTATNTVIQPGFAAAGPDRSRLRVY